MGFSSFRLQLCDEEIQNDNFKSIFDSCKLGYFIGHEIRIVSI